MCALIPAAGRGARFGAAENKVFAPLLGRPLIGWSLEAFARCDCVDDILLIGSENDLPRLREIATRYGGGKVRDLVRGGEDRQTSVRNGLDACSDDIGRVLIHDAARPCVTPLLIEAVLAATFEGRGVSAALPVVDTLARQDEPVDRADLYAIQTPQGFPAARLRTAHQRALAAGFRGTDDAGVYREFAAPPHRDPIHLVPGSPENLKVTQPGDLALAEAILRRRQETSERQVPSSRIGYGYDVHPFAENRKLVLGGVAFPEAPRGLLGHSDADVLLHALCDALLGAAGMGDIGQLFPPSDIAHKDRSSLEFVREVKERLDIGGWVVGNVDMTLLAEAPRIGPRVAEMKTAIAGALGIAPEQIGIKATTNEGLGFVGRSEGIAAHAVALLHRPTFGRADAI